ncbi:MAG: glutathione S-transferase family protein [Gammaproteobacteria bacterium]
MKLYAMPWTCALAPHIALEWIGEPYELVMMKKGQHLKPDYLNINPKGKVPALVVETGKVLTEAPAVLMYLADRFPDARLGPADATPEARYDLLECLSFMSSEVHAHYTGHFAPQRLHPDKAEHDRIKVRTYERLADDYAALEKRMIASDHPVAGRRTVADAFLFVLTRWLDLTPLDIGDYPGLERFRQSMEEDADVERALEQHELTAAA